MIVKKNINIGFKEIYLNCSEGNIMFSDQKKIIINKLISIIIHANDYY